ncbi:hypothetical protein N8T08_004354 [Aspergillus melleus]|uniref:Uncharacterized protein n=1 Tax=Aspergillus melleus TaxID=138277 RepID=A0ACC3B553_9EURO|nr:hypothetical protein N8T08_004354 [Aspergillus melleus]
MNSSNNQEGQGNRTSRQVPPTWSAYYHGLTPLKGFANPGVLCYRNSALCLVLHSPVLINWMASHYWEQNCTKGKQCIVCLLYRLVVSFWKGDSEGENKDAVLKRLWAQVEKRAWFEKRKWTAMLTEWNNGHSEFQVQGMWRDSKEAAPIEIGDYLKNCYSETPAVDLDCERCKCKTKHDLSDAVTDVPEILLICLNRKGIGESKSFWNVGLSDQMVLPESWRRGLAGKDGIDYELYTIVFHDGPSIKSGHYTAAVRAPTGQWMLMDDDAEAQPMQSLETLMNMGSGDEKHTATAYLLAYRRLPLGGESAPAEGQAEPAEGESAAVGDSSKQEQVQGDTSGPSEEVSDQTQAMPLEEPSPTYPAVDPAVLVPDSEIAPSSPKPPSPVGSRTSRPSSPVRPGVTMDGTITLDGREVEWTIQQQLPMPSDAGPLIKLKPRAKVQRANIRLTLASGEDVLEGEVTISLKPAASNAQAQKLAKTPKTMNTKAKKTAKTAGQKKKKSTTSSKQAKQPGGVKKGTKADSTGKSNTKTKTTITLY